MQPNFISRIELNPEILVGKPVIHGTRLSVSFILGLLAHGMTIPEILSEYEGLEREDILACLEFAQQRMEKETMSAFFEPQPLAAAVQTETPAESRQKAAAFLLADYENNPELTAFSVLETDAFYKMP